MLRPFSLLLALAGILQSPIAFAQDDVEPGLADKQLTVLVEAQCRRVAMIPVVNVVIPATEETDRFPHPIADSMKDKLLASAHQSLVSMTTGSGSFAGKISVHDLEPVMQLREEIGNGPWSDEQAKVFIERMVEANVDSLMKVTLLNYPDSTVTVLDAIPLKSANTGTVGGDDVDPNENNTTDPEGKLVSEMGYAGESYELRRWIDGQLVPIGFKQYDNERVMRRLAYADDERSEQVQYKNRLENLPHPLADESFPFEVTIKVDGQPRQPHLIGNNVFVALSPGEEYTIGLANNSEEAAFMAVYVDGIATLSGSIDEKITPFPRVIPRQFCWDMEVGYSGTIPGFSVNLNGELKSTPFVIAQAGEQTLAQQLGAESKRLGMVTAVIFNKGTDGYPKVEPTTVATRSGPPNGLFIGTATRDEKIFNKVDQDYTGKPKGILLAAVTIYYVTPEALEALIKESEKGGQ